MLRNYSIRDELIPSRERRRAACQHPRWKLPRGGISLIEGQGPSRRVLYVHRLRPRPGGLAIRSQFGSIAITAVVALAMAACDGGSSSPPAPTVTLTSSETDIGEPIPPGHDVTLTWSSTHADSCTASDAWSGPLRPTGSQRVVLGVTSTYSISCSGRGGAATASVTVRVWYPPYVSITADRASVLPNTAVLLTWSAPDAKTCRGVAGLSGTLPTSGSQTSAPLTETTTFAIECSNPWGLAANSTVVTVAMPKFTVIELPMDSAIDLNDEGDVLGQVHTGDGQTSPPYVSAVVWIAGANLEVLGCKDLTSNCSRNYSPAAMNSNRRVVGELVRRDSLERSAFVWQAGDDRVFEYAYEPIILTDINDAGQMIGRYDIPMQHESAFVTSSDGTRVSLGDLGGYGSHASAINNAGHIAGNSRTGADGISHVFLWGDGTMKDLGTLDGASSYAAGINMADEIVGTALIDAPVYSRAFRYANSTFTDLGSFGGAFSAAAAINDAGQIVGGSTLAGEEPQAQRAFLYLNGTMYDLNDLIESLPDTLAFAGRINNRGQILAQGQCDLGDCRYYLLTPVSPP